MRYMHSLCSHTTQAHIHVPVHNTVKLFESIEHAVLMYEQRDSMYSTYFSCVRSNVPLTMWSMILPGVPTIMSSPFLIAPAEKVTTNHFCMSSMSCILCHLQFFMAYLDFKTSLLLCKPELRILPKTLKALVQRDYVSFWVDFHFLKDWANIWKTDL